MRERKSRPTSVIKTKKKLSEIIIEIARIGFTAPFRDQNPAPASFHILMCLAQEAWNMEIGSIVHYPNREYRNKFIENMINKLGLSQPELKQQLISTDLETIIEMMRTYKKSHFADDRRQIIACGFTEEGRLRVAWK